MDNETILKEFIETVWNEKNFDSVSKFVHPAYTIHLDPGDPWEGKTLDQEEYKQRLKYSFDSFPDMNFAIQTAISDGDYVVIIWILTGTNSGEIQGFPATNRSVKTNGATIYRFIDGKVGGHYQVFDKITVMKQLGFID